MPRDAQSRGAADYLAHRAGRERRDRAQEDDGAGIVVMDAAALQSLLKSLRAEIDARLPEALVSLGGPARLQEAMAYSLLAPGKRLRPILVLMATEAAGGERQAAMPAAVAVEMVHTYSLIHDDLPAMDDDDLRRGRPTCHKAFDEATAILAGNALLTLAFEVLASGIQDAEVSRRCARVLAEAAGYAGMVGGQMDDMLQLGQAGGTIEQLRAIHVRKTGALIRAAIHLGALVGELGQPHASVPPALDGY